VPHDNIKSLDSIERDLPSPPFQGFLQRVEGNLNGRDVRGRFFKRKVYKRHIRKYIKAKPFQRMQKLFLLTRNALAFFVSDVQFANSMLKKPASEMRLRVKIHNADFQHFFHTN
jgi:hypothetical protein